VRVCGVWVRAAALLLLLTGCAGTPHTDSLRSAPPADLSPRVELTAVPFFPQEAYQCGPAALATLLVASGVETTPEALTGQVYLPARRGSLQVELIAAARRAGRVAYPLAPRLEAPLREVAAGHPVLLLQNLGLSWLPQWHYAVLVGYDLEAGQVVLRSGRERRRVVPLSLFERTWRRGGHWAVTVLAPHRLPLTAEERGYLQAVLPLEAQGRWETARAAYAAALGRWPKSAAAAMGLSNALYALGERGAAEEQLRTLLEYRPDYAPAHNNLGQILLERGAWVAAETHARRAVALGGPHLERYEQTLRAILERAR